MHRLLLSLLLVASGALPAAAEPFGLVMGQFPGTLAHEQQIGGVYMLTDVPRPHPDLVLYSAVAGQATGVCRAVGISGEFALDGHGEAVRAAMAEHAEGLAAAYGQPVLVDELVPEARLTAPEEWAWAVRDRERRYELVWSAPLGAPFAGDVTTVTLAASADAYDTTWFAVRYVFANDAACLAEIEAVRAEGQ